MANTSIPLSVRTVDFQNPLSNLIALQDRKREIGRQAEKDKRDAALFEQQQTVNNQNIRLNDQNIAENQRAADAFVRSAATQQYIEDTLTGANLIEAAMQSQDPATLQGAMMHVQAMNERYAGTDYASGLDQDLQNIQSGNLEAVLSGFNSEIQTFERLGKLAKGELRTVSAGDTVIDASGNEIYKAPEKKTPNQPFNPDGSPNPAFQDYERSVAQAGSGGVQLTPAQRAVDTNFAKEYSDYIAGGGFADVEKNIGQLEEAVQILESGEQNITGPLINMVPDAVKRFTNPDSLSLRQQVEEVVQRNLRLVLGAQFTEREGERLISRAFDAGLSEEENLKRVKRLLDSVKTAAAAKQRAVSYYETNGTLQGFNGTIPTMESIGLSAEPVGRFQIQVIE